MKRPRIATLQSDGCDLATAAINVNVGVSGAIERQCSTETLCSAVRSSCPFVQGHVVISLGCCSQEAQLLVFSVQVRHARTLVEKSLFTHPAKKAKTERASCSHCDVSCLRV